MKNLPYLGLAFLLACGGDDTTNDTDSDASADIENDAIADVETDPSTDPTEDALTDPEPRDSGPSDSGPGDSGPGDAGPDSTNDTLSDSATDPTDDPGLDPTSDTSADATTDPTEDTGPASPLNAGNPYPEATCDVPDGAGLADVSSPTTVIGDGTPASCSSSAVVAAVATGGVITFNCGPDPITIAMDETARVFNDTGPEIVIDGGGLITLSGQGERRILYMNTCDPNQNWTTSHCDDQDHPRLTVQNMRFADADSTGETEYRSGGAIYASGGQLRVVNSEFVRNRCAPTGPDLGGAGIYAFQQFEDRPVYVVNSTFGGSADDANVCSNGGGISSIGVSWTIINSLFSYNRAIGNGGNPTLPGTPGGGSGGAIYNDGNLMTLSLCGTRLEHNEVVQHGSAIFFVTNNHTGDIVIDRSNITNNTGGTWYATYPQISNHDDTPISVTDSIIE